MTLCLPGTRVERRCRRSDVEHNSEYPGTVLYMLQYPYFIVQYCRSHERLFNESPIKLVVRDIPFLHIGRTAHHTVRSTPVPVHMVHCVLLYGTEPQATYAYICYRLQLPWYAYDIPV